MSASGSGFGGWSFGVLWLRVAQMVVLRRGVLKAFGFQDEGFWLRLRAAHMQPHMPVLNYLYIWIDSYIEEKCKQLIPFFRNLNS